MVEKKETKEKGKGSEATIKQETPPIPAGEPDLIGKAQSVAEQLEKQNKVHKELLDRQERIEAERRLGGSTEAGQSIKEQTDEEKADEAARKQLEGTGYDELLFPKDKDKKD